jgi:hypothetical protein
MSVRRGRSCLIVAAAALSFVVSTQAFAQSTVQGLVLTKSDLPSSCSLHLHQVVSNSYVEKHRSLTPAQVQSYGRVTGYGNSFNCGGANSYNAISSEAVQFSNTAGAHRYYALIVSGDLRQVQRFGSFHRISTTGMGSEAVGFSYQARILTQGNTLKLFALEIIRRGRFLGTIEADGNVGTWKTSSLTPLMRLLDNRMKSMH